MQLVCLQYKNYFDRLTKKEDSIGEYLAASKEYEIIDDYDFNPADGVDTAIVLGGQYYDYSDKFNYLLVCDGNELISRWYIMDADRTRVGQYKLHIHRDVIVDNWDIIADKPLYVEKGIVSDNSPFIYNSEGLPLNQIKKSETLLKDDSGCAWICGFVAPNSATGQYTIESDLTIDYTATNMSTWIAQYNILFNQVYYKIRERSFRFNILHKDSNYTIQGVTSPTNNSINWSVADVSSDTSNTEFRSTNIADISQLLAGLNNATAMNAGLNGQANGSRIVDKIKYDAAVNIEYLVVHTTSDNKNYEIFTDKLNVDLPETYSTSYSSTILDYFGPSGSVGRYMKNKRADTGKTYVTQSFYRVLDRYEEVASYSTQLTFPGKTDRFHLKDAPYDMFMIPYGDNVTVTNSLDANFGTVNMTKQQSINLAQEIARGLGSNCYDVQLLPYFPDSGIDFNGSGSMDIRSNDSKRYTRTDDKKRVIIWALKSSGTKDITYEINYDNKKITNECDMYRLCSPNYNGQFEFNVAKNGGVTRFNVDYTYLPGSPYIHINPDFNGLYGSDFNDARGLICQGDFSISLMNDKWIEYQIQNKNYENIFSRQIENMDTNRKYQRIQEVVSAGTGALSAGITSGALTGNVAVGIGAGVASAVGGAADVAISDKLYRESVDYAKDTFNFQLDNVRALPQSVSKTTAYTENNKVFPVLEYYSCTDEEKIAIARKIRYEGMTVGVPGTIAEYATNSWSYADVNDKGFIRGRFFELPIPEDFHMASSIEKEIEKGVYTKWE